MIDSSNKSPQDADAVVGDSNLQSEQAGAEAVAVTETAAAEAATSDNANDSAGNDTAETPAAVDADSAVVETVAVAQDTPVSEEVLAPENSETSEAQLTAKAETQASDTLSANGSDPLVAERKNPETVEDATEKLFAEASSAAAAYTSTATEMQRTISGVTAAETQSTAISAVSSAQNSSVAESETAADQITISPDHPMAAFYTQVPVLPDLKGNRVAGTLITLLASIVFALLYAGVLSLFALTQFTGEQLVDEILVHLAAPGYWATAIAFWLGMLLLALIAGRAGWWAYVFGSFLVAGFVLFVAAVAFSFSPALVDVYVSHTGLAAFRTAAWADLVALALTLKVLLAAVVAREVVVWFGKWIGSRGRKITAQNAAAIAEYQNQSAATAARLKVSES